MINIILNDCADIHLLGKALVRYKWLLKALD